MSESGFTGFKDFQDSRHNLFAPAEQYVYSKGYPLIPCTPAECYVGVHGLREWYRELLSSESQILADDTNGADFKNFSIDGLQPHMGGICVENHFIHYLEPRRGDTYMGIEIT